MKKNDKRLINAWASYDWANSAYFLIVVTAIFPALFIGLTEHHYGTDMISFFGIEKENSVLLEYSVSFAYLIIVFISPVLSGIADYGGKKKRFMQFFTYMGSLACIGLFWFDGSNVEWGVICSVIACVGFAGSLVFYNGFLPEVATPDKMDSVSARGFAFGYIGSVLLLGIIILFASNYEAFGLESDTRAYQYGFLMVGIWWMGFAQIAFAYLKDSNRNNEFNISVLTRGLKEIRKVFKTIRSKIVMYRYLLSFFFFSMGVQTVLILAPLFAKKEIGMEVTEMTVLIIIIQFVAIAGAYFFSFLSSKKGNGFSLGTALIIWILICIAGSKIEDISLFYVLGSLLGFVMGGVQSVSRSTYSKLIPTETIDNASFFSFYDITEKLAIVIGSLAFALINDISGDMRNSMLFMAVFFLLGFVFLQLAKLNKNMA